MVDIGYRLETTCLMAVEYDWQGSSPTARLLLGVAKQGMDASLRIPRHGFPPRKSSQAAARFRPFNDSRRIPQM